jgi:uncharacterized repeat protein (TIGR01451 family)
MVDAANGSFTPRGGEGLKVAELPPGTYVVKELDGAGYVTAFKVGLEGDVTEGDSTSSMVVANTNTTVEFTNKLIWYDAALRKWVTAVNGSGAADDVRQSDSTANAGLPSPAVAVKKGDLVEYTIRVFNQSPWAMKVTEIVDDLPEGLEFVTTGPGGAAVNAGWLLRADGRLYYDWSDRGPLPESIPVLYPDVERFTAVGYDYGYSNDSAHPNHADVTVMLKVKNSATGTVTNTAAITGESDENDEPVEDVDSVIDGVLPGEGDVKDNEVGEDGTRGGDEDESDIARVWLDVAPFVSVEVYKDTIKRTSAAFDGTAAGVAVGSRPIRNVGEVEEFYRYDIDFRSTSNVDADEFVLDDPLEAVNKGNAGKGYIRLEGLWTPAVWGDKDGRFNVWYKTKGGSGASAAAPSPAITAVADPVFPTVPYGAGASDGWKLWKTVDGGGEWAASGVIGREFLGLPAGIDAGDYITALRFEFGAVKVGFTSRNYDSYSSNQADVDMGVRNTNGSSAYYHNGTVEPFARPASVAAKEKSVLGKLAALFSGGAPELDAMAQPSEPAGDIPAKGASADWRPEPGRSDYADELGELPDTKNASPLKPATYLVSATMSMSTTAAAADLVSSATARIALGGSGASGLYDQDQDAVLTRELIPFTTSPVVPDVGNIVQTDSFMQNAEFAGVVLRDGVWLAGGLAAKTGDEFPLVFWAALMATVLACLVLLAVLHRRSRKNRRAAPIKGGGLK